MYLNHLVLIGTYDMYLVRLNVHIRMSRRLRSGFNHLDGYWSGRQPLGVKFCFVFGFKYFQSCDGQVNRISRVVLRGVFCCRGCGILA